MDYLPSRDDQDALLDRLADLVRECGYERFVNAPLLEPKPTYFPDRWETSAAGVARLARRLLRYAGLDAYGVHVQVYEEERPAPSPDGSHVSHEGTAAWFAGIQHETCLFGIEVRQLAEDDAVVGAMCHEIAHAFREHHELVGPSRDVEEQDTDVTTVYLGFGVLTTNNAYRFRKTGELRGTRAYTRYGSASGGYLSPQSLSFLLAAQTVARGLDSRAARRVTALLETNQAAFFRAAHKELSKDAAGLARRLGIPPRERWPEPPALLELTRPFDDEHLATEDGEASGESGDDGIFNGDEETVDDDEALADRGPNEGRVVFRVRHTESSRWTLFGLLLGMGAGFAHRTYFDEPALMPLFELMGGGGLIGLFAGALRRSDYCSELTCSGPVPPGLTRCPTCGGAVRGDIDDADDRLAAEEALEDGAPLPTKPHAILRLARGLLIFAAVVAVVAALAALNRHASFSR